MFLKCLELYGSILNFVPYQHAISTAIKLLVIQANKLFVVALLFQSSMHLFYLEKKWLANIFE